MFSIVEITIEHINLFIRCVINKEREELIKCMEGLNELVTYLQSLSKYEKRLQKNILSMGYILILFRTQEKGKVNYLESLHKYLSSKFPNEQILVDQVFLDRLCRFVNWIQVDKIVSEIILESRKDYDEILHHLCIK
jgi:hypothetical protein